MDTKESILTRRSIHRFSERPVERSCLEEVISLASYAPTWKNTQISRYIAIESPDVRQEIADGYVNHPNNASVIKQAPMIVAQSFRKARSGFDRDGSFATDRKDGWQYYDCGIAAQTFCLAAWEKGLGTLVMGVFNRLGLEKYLKLPEEEELMALIALGYPDETPNAPRRKDVGALLRFL